MDHLLPDIMHIFTLSGFGSLLSLTALEIVLGIDNVVFIALLVQHVHKTDREKIRRIGLSLALGMRILLLLSISWVLGLSAPLFTVMGHDFSGKDILLLLGGLFLIYKSTDAVHEIFTEDDKQAAITQKHSYTGLIFQIILVDLVFSFDSVMTAVGLTQNIPIIIIAMSIAMLIMLFFTGLVSDFITEHPTLKTLAISFILLIGVLLVAEAFGVHLPRGYIYFAMAFSGAVETMNIVVKTRKRRQSLGK